jgi:hypothetical protein
VKLVFWLLVAVALFYGFYSSSMAVWSYFQVSEVVEDTFSDPRKDRTDPVYVRTTILKGVAARGITVDERDVVVTPYAGAMGVQVRWKYPMFSYDDETVLAIPLSLDRTVAVTEGVGRR